MSCISSAGWMWKRVWAVADRSGRGSFREITVMEWKHSHRKDILGQFGFDEAVVVLGLCSTNRAFRDAAGTFWNIWKTHALDWGCAAFFVKKTDSTVPVKRIFSMLLMWNTVATYHVFSWPLSCDFFHLICKQKNPSEKLTNTFQPPRMYSFYFWCSSWRTGGPGAGPRMYSAHSVLLFLTSYSCITSSNEFMYAMCVLFEDLLSLCNSVFCSPSCKSSSFHIEIMTYRLMKLQKCFFFHF